MNKIKVNEFYKWITSEEFNRILYTYRTAPDHMPDLVYDAYTDVIESIRNKLLNG